MAAHCNDSIRAQIKEEVSKAVLANDHITYSGNTPILDAFIYEVARCAPTAGGSARICLKEYDITNTDGDLLYHLRSNAVVVIL